MGAHSVGGEAVPWGAKPGVPNHPCGEEIPTLAGFGSFLIES